MIDRREWIERVGLSGAGLAAAPFQIIESDQAEPTSERAWRIAHITDPHLHSEKDSAAWTRSCLRMIHAMEDRPDVIFNGGDTINDALGQEEDAVSRQWAIWNAIRDEEIALPLVHCIGNHDVWGLPEASDDPRYAKSWAVEELGLSNRYYDFQQNGWHFIVLDSTQPREDGSWYIARLDEEQFQWLKSRLEDIDSARPVFIFSHIPIVCAASFFDGNNEKTGDWVIPGQWVHIDARRIVELFHRHENVKLCISGHIHLLDKVVYNDVTYYCDGAVSGNWWTGSYHQTPPGFALINLYEDGTFNREYVAYGWEA